MKKNFLFFLIIFFGISRLAFSAACSTANSGTTTTWPTTVGSSGKCFAEPDYYKLTLYDMKLCTSSPTAPTSTSAMVLTSCQNVFYNASGNAIEISNGSSSAMVGTITRPDNGSYTHGYIRISKDFVIGDSRKYTSAATDGTNQGVYCATDPTNSSYGVQCSSSEITLTSSDYRTMTLSDFGSDTYTFNTTQSSEEINAYLVGTDEYLDTADDSSGYLVGVQTFSSPVVITDSTTTMDAAFKVSEGMDIYRNSAHAAPVLGLYNGPFFVKMTVK